MKFKLTGSSFSLLVVMVIGLVIVALALSMPFVSKVLPLIFGGTITILAAIKLWDESQSKKKVETKIKDIEDTGEQIEESTVPLHDYLPIGGWVLGFLVAIYLLGFLIACPLLIFSYMKTHGGGWLITIISTIVIALIVYFGFQTALQVDLYPGLLIKWLTG